MLEFLRGLDEVVLDHGGRVYLAKDTCMKPASFERMYPSVARFREVKARIDPHNRFASSQSKRLGIVAPAAGGASNGRAVEAVGGVMAGVP